MKKIWVSSFLFLAVFPFFMSSPAFNSGSGLSSFGNSNENRRNMCEPVNGIKKNFLSDMNKLPASDQLTPAEKHRLELTYMNFESSPPPPEIRKDPLLDDTPGELKELIHSSLEFAMLDLAIDILKDEISFDRSSAGSCAAMDLAF